MHAKSDAQSIRGRLRQMFDYLVVYDLEATCDEKKQLHPQVNFQLLHRACLHPSQFNAHLVCCLHLQSTLPTPVPS